MIHLSLPAQLQVPQVHETIPRFPQVLGLQTPVFVLVIPLSTELSPSLILPLVLINSFLKVCSYERPEYVNVSSRALTVRELSANAALSAH